MMLRAQHHRLTRVGKKLIPAAAQIRDGSSQQALLPSVPDARCDHHRTRAVIINNQHRSFGSFYKNNNDNNNNNRNEDDDNWYRESYNTVVADLKQELSQDPRDVVPSKPLDPIKSLRNIIQRGRTTVSSVNHCFSLLDQLVLEKNHEGGSRRSDLDFHQLTTTSILNPLVQKWKVCWSQQHKSSTISRTPPQETTTTTTTVELLAPWNLIDKINIYQDTFSQFLPNTETYNMILWVASQNYNNTEDYHHLGLFVQSMVDQMEVQALSNADLFLGHPDSETFNILVQTWAKAGNLQEVQNVLRSFRGGQREEGITHNNNSYNYNKDVLHLSQETLDAISKATTSQLDAISNLHKDLQLQAPPSPLLPPTTTSLPSGGEVAMISPAEISTPSASSSMPNNRNEKPQIIKTEDIRMLRQWIKSRSTVGVSKAFQRLDEIILSNTTVHDDGGDSSSIVPTNIVNDLIKSWKRCWMKFRTTTTTTELMKPVDVMEKVLAYNDDHQQQNNGGGGVKFRLDTRTYNTLMEAIVTTHKTNNDMKMKQESLRLCKVLFQRMLQQQEHNSDSDHGGDKEAAAAAPDSQTYNRMILLHAEAGDIQGALDLLIYLRDRPTKEDEIQISLNCFREILIQCLNLELRTRTTTTTARQRQQQQNPSSRNLGFLADSIIDLMDQLIASGRVLPEKDGRHFTTANIYRKAIRCWEESGHPESPKRIKELFAKLEQFEMEEEQGEEIGHRRRSNVNDVRKRSMRPAKNRLVDALAKQGDAEAAQSYLEQMCQEYESGKLEMQPDRRSFNAVIHAWAQRGEGEKAEQVLRTMYRLYDTGRYLNVQPNAFSFNCVIHGWSKSSYNNNNNNNNNNGPIQQQKNPGERAIALLDELERLSSQNPDVISLKPSTMTYTSVMNCLARDGDAETAEALLQKMHDKSKNGKNNKSSQLVQPNTRSYNAVLRAWGESRSNDAGVHAERLLRRMYELYEKGMMEQIFPDYLSYNFVIQAWANSGHPQSGEEAERIFQEMINTLPGEPDKETLGLVVCAWAKSGNTEKAEDCLLGHCQRYINNETTVIPAQRTFDYLLNNTQVPTTIGGGGGGEVGGTIEAADERAVRLSNRMEDLVRKMIDEYKTDNHCKTLSSSSNNNTNDNSDSVAVVNNNNNNKPDILRGFHMLLIFYNRIKHPNAGAKADEALKWMEELDTKGIVPGLKATDFTHKIVRWCRGEEE